jgi:N-acetylglucosamine kinase-like BadF-type ATPase
LSFILYFARLALTLQSNSYITMILLADSGSTKTDWCLAENQHGVLRLKTQGINPYQQDEATIKSILQTELLPQMAEYRPKQLFFYGSGCTVVKADDMHRCLTDTLSIEEIEVQTDLMAAARALCQHEKGIACILGTGSNSCLYDGDIITSNVPPLGYILGDEGSGAVLGRQLVGNIIKGQMPKELKEEFLSTYHLTVPEIIENVYRRPLANRYLASLSLFMASHREVEEIHRLLLDSFMAFFRRNVAHYGCPELPVNFIGGIAHQYSTELEEAASATGFTLGTVVQSPMEGMIRFHAIEEKE